MSPSERQSITWQHAGDSVGSNPTLSAIHNTLTIKALHFRLRSRVRFMCASAVLPQVAANPLTPDFRMVA